MSRFLGEYEVPVDEKGRVFIPAEIRRKLQPEDGDTLVVVRGLDGCPVSVICRSGIDLLTQVILSAEVQILIKLRDESVTHAR